MLRIAPIVARDLRHSHPDNKPHATDVYYTKLANRLMQAFVSARVDLGDHTFNILRCAAISLASYVEDIVADSGQWRAFSDLCQQMFGWPVPMYHDDREEYYPDEPSLMAVRYLIWNAATEQDDVWWKPEVLELERLAHIAYQRIDSVFEEAPVNEQLNDDIDKLLHESTLDFLKMRPALIWLFCDSYVTRSGSAEKLLQKYINESEELSDVMTERMRMHYAIMNCIFQFRMGPLALFPKDYLAALMRTRGMTIAAADAEAIELLRTGSYKYTVSADGQTLHLERTNGQKLQVAREEITLSDEQLREFNACLGVFVSYQGAWHMNGVMMPFQVTDSDWEEICKKAPGYMPEGLLMADADWYLNHTDGKPLLFFANRQEAWEYLKAHQLMAVNNSDMLSELNSGLQPVMMFIDGGDPQGCLQFSHGFTPCVAAPENPFYNQDTARQEAVEMLWNDDCISTGAVLYMLDHGYLPELLTDDMLCQDSPDSVKEADARFLLRYMRREKY